MKLYATVSSERASKGQGGNKYLRTSYTAEMANGAQLEILIVHIEPSQRGFQINISSRHGDELYSEEYVDETKGNKQKGDEYGCIFDHEHGNGSKCEYHSL